MRWGVNFLFFMGVLARTSFLIMSLPFFFYRPSRSFVFGFILVLIYLYNNKKYGGIKELWEDRKRDIEILEYLENKEERNNRFLLKQKKIIYKNKISKKRKIK